MNIVSVYLPTYSDLKIEFVWKGVKIVSEVSPLNGEVQGNCKSGNRQN